MHRDRKHRAGFLLADLQGTVGEVLASHTDHIGVTLPGVEQQRECQPRPGANRIGGLISGDVVLSPGVDFQPSWRVAA